jgi:hypothetical protein
MGQQGGEFAMKMVQFSKIVFDVIIHCELT